MTLRPIVSYPVRSILDNAQSRRMLFSNTSSKLSRSVLVTGLSFLSLHFFSVESAIPARAVEFLNLLAECPESVGGHIVGGIASKLAHEP